MPLCAHAQGHQTAPKHPWQDATLSPDARADLVVNELTLEEKVQLVHGTGWGILTPGNPIPPGSNYGAGFVPGIGRLGIPGINLADSAVGVRMAAVQSRYATLLPSVLGAASSWDPAAAILYGQVIGRELRAQGFNMSIGGGVNLLREPRNGRNFEYAGEDPLLAGTMAGLLEQGVASQHVMNDIKHYALNDQETGRTILNTVIDERAMRESDLLAFEIAIGIAKPSGVMCSYNKVNGDYACENDYLLNQVLKHDFGFQGFVLSDWEATHSTVKAALAGLDMEQPSSFDGKSYFGRPLQDAVLSSKVPIARLNDMAHRILRSMFAAGVIDHPTDVRSVVDPFRGRDDAQHIAEESIVLLRNAHDVLPLSPNLKSIAIIGGHADVGVLSGGGSAQVDAPGGNALDHKPGTAEWEHQVYFPSVPLRTIAEHAPQTRVSFNNGTDPAAAAAFARTADVAIVFVTQFLHEDGDAKSLALPDNQDALVEAVAAANPHTIVVIESGGPITMPWANRVAGIVEAWYPGIGGAQALANILFGTVNLSGKLAATFAQTEADLPHPLLAGSERDHTIHAMDAPSGSGHKPFNVTYSEGARVGYKWFDSENKQPLFPFGFGLSYTTYAYSALTVDSTKLTATFTVKNTGKREGTEIAELYVQVPGENFKRLAGWQRVTLAPGESKTANITIDPRLLSIFDTVAHAFKMPAGEFQFFAGPSSRELPLHSVISK
ncbi:MAG TPA: glycoside hydrolase family 3 C-terminal domain-containing protein [Acidobacteriaceae bacterium]